MNDFTKEELIDIYESFDECFRPFSEIEKSIFNKLKIMIDNYKSTECSKCKEISFADGRCWNLRCYYE
jgi:hypothetical protein